MSVSANESPPCSTVSSTSSAGAAKNGTDPLVSATQCPICYDISLPLLQCKNGHIFCKICFDSLVSKTCPECRVSCACPIRNLALEKLVESSKILLACKYAENGCDKKLMYKEKVNHQALCKFKTHRCPIPHCSTEGSLDQILAHLVGRRRVLHHNIEMTHGESSSLFFSILEDNEEDLFVQIQYCFDTVFLVVFKLKDDQNEMYSALVQCIGTEETAAQFAYRFDLERPGRRLCWEAAPLSISDNILLTIENGDCLQFCQKSFELFKSQDANIIRLNVTITKCD